MAEGYTFEARGRSISADPRVTGEDFAEYFAGGLVEARRVAADNAAWIHDSLACCPENCTTSFSP